MSVYARSPDWFLVSVQFAVLVKTAKIWVDMDGDTHYCPACGRPTKYLASPEWLLGKFSGRYANVLAALLEARREKRGLSITELCEAAYIEFEHDKTRMPSDPVNSIRSFISQRNHDLAPMGWTVVSPTETNQNGYWLVPVDAE